MNSIPCNIVILPDESISQKAVKVSGNLSRLGSHFTLKDGSFYPHITIYMTQLRLADMDRVGTLLAGIAKRATKLELSATQYFQIMGYIDAEYARAAALDTLQVAILETINPIRDGMREKDKLRMATATGKDREYFEQYGYPKVHELFRPH